MLLLAIDPGIDTGWAVFRDGELEGCGLGELPRGTFDEAMIECPQSYPKTRENANDLITLAFMAGRLLEKVDARVKGRCHPREWKGQQSKTLNHDRIRKSLSSAEFVVLAGSMYNITVSKQHNVIDAVGIGLWAVGRGV